MKKKKIIDKNVLFSLTNKAWPRQFSQKLKDRKARASRMSCGVQANEEKVANWQMSL